VRVRADAVKHLIVRPSDRRMRQRGHETGPNAILLSDLPVQGGTFANLAEFPVLQMLYRQGMMLPGHPNNDGRRPMLIGLGDQLRAQAAYIFRGNYGLASLEELRATGLAEDRAREIWRWKLRFAFDRMRGTDALLDLREAGGDLSIRSRRPPERRA
jgi:hemerythrin